MSSSIDTLPDQLDVSIPPESRELGRLSLFFVCITLTTVGAYWASLRLRGVPVVDVLSSPGIAGLALPTLAYARFRGIDLSPTRPRPADVGTTLAVVALPLLALVATTIGTPLVFGTSFAAAVGSTYHPQASFLTALSQWAESTILTGVGYGVLTATVFELLRSRASMPTKHAVVFTAGLGVFFDGMLRGSAYTVVVFPKQWRLALFGILLVSTVAGGVSLGLFYRSVLERSIRVLYRPLFVPVFALGLILIVAFAALFADVPDGFEHVLWALAFGSAAYGYDQTKSVVVPVVVLSLFGLSVPVSHFFELAVF
ncbi:hypothetical protein [Haloferax sp. DFSO52]|uniref:hypothetical protein n=1 Tax=Haloferax sp. DFSO52 TaxID=3388505 RepID=UPI003A8B73F3